MGVHVGRSGTEGLLSRQDFAPVFADPNIATASWSTCFLKVMRGSDLNGSLCATPQTHPRLISPDSFQTDHQQDEEAACTTLPPG